MSLINEINKDLKEKIDNLTEKTKDQPLIHVYEWIRNNAKIVMYQTMILAVPEDKRNETVQHIIMRFVNCLEKVCFDHLSYLDYSEKMRNAILHSKHLCMALFSEISKGFNAQDIILEISHLLKQLSIPLFLNKMFPDHPIYGTNENVLIEKKMKREEREKEIKDLFPKSDLQCLKCKKSDDVRFESMQRRSFDEPPDEFYFCVPCNFRFRGK